MSTMPRIHTTLTILALLAGPLVACDPPEADDPFAATEARAIPNAHTVNDSRSAVRRGVNPNPR